MKIFRVIVLTVFLFTSAMYGFFYFYNRSRTDTTIPVISFVDEVLEVSVTDDESVLLKDVIAFDQKDGDLTGRIIVEQISNFIKKGVSKITYAVIDGDNHVAKKERRIRYINYESPHFTLSKAMRFALGSNINVLDIIGAKDNIDGDLSNKIKITSSDLSENIAGVYQMHAEVANSKGDLSGLDFNVTIFEGNINIQEIKLKDYLVYKHVGDPFDAKSYIENSPVTEGYSVSINDENLNMTKAGDYQVDYFITNENGINAMTSLIVVVEE